MPRAKTDRIIIHCAATTPDMDIGVAQIDRWHRARGFLKVGYHFVIRRDGTVEKGRDPDQPGAHAKGWNHRSVGICLVGGVRRTDDGMVPDSNFTDGQWESLEHLVRGLLDVYPDAYVIGHNQVSSKACPSFDVTAWAREHGLPTTD